LDDEGNEIVLPENKSIWFFRKGDNVRGLLRLN
jgi:hypothetical protein